MGTYTTNYNLFLPTIGEQGWGDLVNGNFTTIDNAMSGLDTRISALEPLSVIHVDENQNVTFPANITATEFVGGVGNFESGLFSTMLNVGGNLLVDGSINNVNITNDGTITTTKSITTTEGFNGNVQGFLFVKGDVQTYGDVVYATCNAISTTLTSKSSSSPHNIIPYNYDIVYGNPVKHGIGVYTRREDLTGITNPSISTRQLKVNIYSLVNATGNASWPTVYIHYRKSGESWSTATISLGWPTMSAGQVVRTPITIDALTDTTYQFYVEGGPFGNTLSAKVEIPASPSYYVTYATP